MPSTYFTRLKSAVQNGIQRNVSGKEIGLQDSLQVLIWQRKFGFGNYRFLHSARFSAFTELQALLQPGIVLAERSNSLLVDKRSISVVGTLSRTFSVPSVSGTAFQVCGYHIDRALSDSSQTPVSKFQSIPMAACGSRALVGECFLDTSGSRHMHVPFSTNSSGIFYSNRRIHSCTKARMSLKNQEKPNNSQIYGFFMYSAAKRWCEFNQYWGLGLRDFHSSLPTCLSAGTAPDVSFDNSSREEQLARSAVSSEENSLAGKTLKLISGSCSLPHPDKEETGGEDAHFVCPDEQAIGVADGVGGWAAEGIDSGLYSRELMSNSVSAIRDEPKGSVDPARVLEKAHSVTKAKGSSTACIVALTDQGLHAINLGDSGFMVIRDGCTIFRSPVQQHDFNFTFQLENGVNGDLPSSGQVFTISVAPGDVIVAGTDGLFDNLYNNEITAVVVHAVRAGLGPQVTAQKIAALARQRAQETDRQTPFSTAAQDAGFRYYGGKLDDITVVVSFVTASSEENKSS